MYDLIKFIENNAKNTNGINIWFEDGEWQINYWTEEGNITSLRSIENQDNLETIFQEYEESKINSQKTHAEWREEFKKLKTKQEYVSKESYEKIQKTINQPAKPNAKIQRLMEEASILEKENG